MKSKKKVFILVIVCLIILIGAFVFDRFLGKSYLNEIEYDEVIEKIENKEDFVLLISQTTCSHCISYKPKLEDVANKYELNVYYIDVNLLDEDERNELISRLSLGKLETPVTLFLKNGEETTVANRIKGDVKEKYTIIKKLKSNGFISE